MKARPLAARGANLGIPPPFSGPAVSGASAARPWARSSGPTWDCVKGVSTMGNYGGESRGDRIYGWIVLSLLFLLYPVVVSIILLIILLWGFLSEQEWLTKRIFGGESRAAKLTKRIFGGVLFFMVFASMSRRCLDFFGG